eukprot:CAMPEP_0116541248 /NCGR_PEP_ID=MMETSP0397-20121206/382_1 /TAXON_ID=216820 /ORGANISM="Cyclophora tenuis, Strain ECT3854" /LENGTH=200 /DNA_ID=CAMNT_0004065179 /DNA_START=185 /DNA_END=787 /DNA_ORIENTATION=-
MAVVLWATKLAAFLFYRILHVGHDGRLDTTLSTVTGAAMFWTISWLWGVLCSLPHTLGATSSSPGVPVLTYLGFFLFDLGFAIESLSDYQKWQFKAAQNNNDGFCDVGLWRYSQHPNFFGNLVLWFGILVMNAPALKSSSIRFIAIFLSPLFLWTLLSGQANGTITNAVQMSFDKYGHNPDYERYIETVPKIIPFPLSTY